MASSPKTHIIALRETSKLRTVLEDILNFAFGSKKRACVVCATVGFTFAVIAGIIKYSRRKRGIEEPPGSRSRQRLLRIDSGRMGVKLRASPSIVTEHSGRSLHRSDSHHIADNALSLVMDNVNEVVRNLDKISRVGCQLLRQRSDKDRDALDELLKKAVELQADLDRFRCQCNLHEPLSPSIQQALSHWESSVSQRHGTLSVLSDDSFMSALDDLAPQFDDLDMPIKEPLKIELKDLHIYNRGREQAATGRVLYRKSRTEFCECDSEDDYAAKLWCLRQAFTEILADERNRQTLIQSGRFILADLLRQSAKDPTAFYSSYDKMIDFLAGEDVLDYMAAELEHRRVVEMGFWDVVVDFILLDAFEDLSRPPSAVLAVAQNRFLSDSFKENTLATVIWSMLKAKRQRLLVSDGFIARFYDISEQVSPAITWGLLGTDERLRNLCYYFKDQICAFAVDIYDKGKVRYTSIRDLADDVWTIMEARLEMVKTRISTELLPPHY